MHVVETISEHDRGRLFTSRASSTSHAGVKQRVLALLRTPRVVRRIGRFVKGAAHLRGGGTALPGLVVERIDPLFLSRVLGTLPEGVVVVSGTNGKTTTTKIIVQLLRASGMRVVTNKSGSNFTRGIIAGLLGDIDADGNLDADVAVLELDEAHAVRFVEQVRPRYTLLLNVMRDQLDRFGEIDFTAGLLERVALAATDGVVLNRDDLLVRRIATKLSPAIDLRYFGIRASLKDVFLSDHDLYGSNDRDAGVVPQVGGTDVILTAFDAKIATYSFGDALQAPVELGIDGIYNSLNAGAALSLARMILGDRCDTRVLMTALQSVRAAFGRGETIDIGGHPLELVLVKNPAGFRLALQSYSTRAAATMIAINDNYADGRDVSWLWDVDFRHLDRVAVVSGDRAYDMALRLQYDDITATEVESSLPRALEDFLAPPGPKRIYCTYTAMMTIRRILARRFDMVGVE